MSPLVAVVELSTFIREVEPILSEEEREELKFFLAAHPEAGVVIPNGGGVRKLRWAASGRGKRGGARVIYYYHDLEMPLVSIFTKAQKSDLDAGELKAAWKRRSASCAAKTPALAFGKCRC